MSRRPTSPVALALFCLALMPIRAGAAGADEGAAPAGAAAAPAEPMVKLLSAGEGPKRELRYALKQGTVETMAMDIDTSMKMSAGGQGGQQMNLPTIGMTIRMRTTEVLPSGDARISMEFADASVGGNSTLPPQAVEQMRQSLQRIKGLKGTATITPKGRARGAKFDVPANADPQTAQALKQAEQQMSQMAAPLPDEPVGKGARWEVATTLNSNGLRVNQTATYTLKELSPESATFDVQIKQSAPRQALQGATVERMESTGGGTTTIRFDRLVPENAAAKVDMNMVVAGAGQPGQKMTMDMTMKMKMRPGEEK